MTATNSFFNWFYTGLNGLGGWLIFLLLALAGMIWLLYDSANRRIPALGWRLGVTLTTALILPAIVYRFTIDPSNPLASSSPLASFPEPIFYLGILGGILPIVLAVGYYVTYQGMVGCSQGHVYEAALGQCPYDTVPASPLPAAPIHHPSPTPRTDFAPEPPRKKRTPAHAWLVTNGGRDYQLYQGTTTIGRSNKNDIYLTGDNTVSHEHAKIVEENGHFRLHDLGSTNYTRVNGRIMRQPVLLDADDEIQFGDGTVVRFVTSRH